MSSLLLSSTAFAQQRHVADPAQMRQAIADQALIDQQNRGVVLGVLQNAQVRELAGRLGLNVTRAEGAIATLDSTELSRLAEPARAAQADLAGGSQMVVISLTTLLLIIIIVILVAD